MPRRPISPSAAPRATASSSNHRREHGASLSSCRSRSGLQARARRKSWISAIRESFVPAIEQLRGEKMPNFIASEGRKPWYRILYLQVLVAIALGVALGHFWPASAVEMKPLGDGFIKLIKMVIALVIFCTVVSGISGMENMKKVGRVGGKALLYFEAVSTLALLLGLIVATLVKPGAGFNADPATLDVKAVAAYAGKAKEQTVVEFVLNIIPNTIVDARSEEHTSELQSQSNL